MKTPPFSGAFQWGKVRRQLLSLRDDVQSIRKIAGRNVTVSEHKGKGSVINVTRERGTAAGVCPDPDVSPTVTCTISGVSLNCGCINIYNFDPDHPEGVTLLAVWEWSDPPEMNATHILTRDMSDTTHWGNATAGQVYIKSWIGPDFDCPSGTPFSEGYTDFHIDAYCVDGTWQVFVTFGASPISLFFYGTGSTNATIINSVPHCGWPMFLLTHGFFTNYYVGANTDGQAIITA